MTSVGARREEARGRLVGAPSAARCLRDERALHAGDVRGPDGHGDDVSWGRREVDGGRWRLVGVSSAGRWLRDERALQAGDGRGPDGKQYAWGGRWAIR